MLKQFVALALDCNSLYAGSDETKSNNNLSENLIHL